MINNEAGSVLITDREENSSFIAAPAETYGNYICGSLPENALILTAHIEKDGTYVFQDSAGRYFSCRNQGGGLELKENRDDTGLSQWELHKEEGGYTIVNAAAGRDKPEGVAIQYYKNQYSVYRCRISGTFLCNFYEIPE